MYKNTFDKVISELEKEGFHVKNLLTVISFYKEPIDLYSLYELIDDKISVSDIEKICDYLSNRLVLNKKGEMYDLNEFAAKFILVKFLPDKVKANRLSEKISAYKFDIRRKFRQFEEKRSSRDINQIMDDWKPRNDVEKIVIINVFSLYGYVTGNLYRDDISKQNLILTVEERFAKNEAMTTHPYVKFQKAKIYEKFLENSVNEAFLTTVANCYEDVIYSVEFDYKYIFRSRSYAYTLWFYGLFLVKYHQDYLQALPRLEQSKELFEKLSLESEKSYSHLLNTMVKAYEEVAKINKSDRALYLREANLIREQINKKS